MKDSVVQLVCRGSWFLVHIARFERYITSSRGVMNMDKNEIIDMMHDNGFSEHVEEICQHGNVSYSVSWTRLSDQLRGPTVTRASATDAFMESAFKALSLVEHQLKTGKLT